MGPLYLELSRSLQALQCASDVVLPLASGVAPSFVKAAGSPLGAQSSVWGLKFGASKTRLFLKDLFSNPEWAGTQCLGLTVSDLGVDAAAEAYEPWSKLSIYSLVTL